MSTKTDTADRDPNSLRSHIKLAFRRLATCAGFCDHPAWALIYQVTYDRNLKASQVWHCQLCLRDFPTLDTPEAFELEEDYETLRLMELLNTEELEALR